MRQALEVCCCWVRGCSTGEFGWWVRLALAPGLTPTDLARAIAQALEEEIRRRPEDWLWIYRRQAWLNPAEYQDEDAAAQA